MSQQKLVDIPFFDLSIENRKRLVFCIDFFNARVLEARKHKCEYIGKESPAYSKKRMGKEGYPYVVNGTKLRLIKRLLYYSKIV